MRTTGSVEPYAELKVKRRIDAKQMPEPSIDATAPYLEGAPTRFAQMHELKNPEEARRMVDYWAGEGMTSFKAYMNISRDTLGAAIQAAHAHKLKLTGHLCSVTWPEAIALGIDEIATTGAGGDVCGSCAKSFDGARGNRAGRADDGIAAKRNGF
jgi:hypothetical protein